MLWFDVDFLNLATDTYDLHLESKLWFDVDFLNLATRAMRSHTAVALWFDVDFLNLATLRDNADRIETAEKRGTLPYFITDNKEVVNGILKPSEARKTPLEIAKERHKARTKEDIEKIKHKWNNHREYVEFKNNADYYDVKFNYDNGGLMATHKGHNFDKVGGHWEKEVQQIGYTKGHSVILENEYGNTIGERFTEGTWDGMEFELATRETATENNILRGLKHCADKRITEVAVLYFPNGGYAIDKLEAALRRYLGYAKFPERTYVKFKRVVCIENGGIVYDVVL